MGSWLETCGISRLPIDYGDKCRVFILANHGSVFSGGLCYINDYWYPRGLPIACEYDDCGDVCKIVEDVNSKILENNIKSNWVNYKASNKYITSYCKKSLNLATILEAINAEVARVYDAQSKKIDQEIEMAYSKNVQEQPSNNKPLPEDRKIYNLSSMFVLEDVYQAMLSYNKQEADIYEGGYLYKDLSTILKNDMEEFYTEGLERFANKTDYPDYMFTINNHWNLFSGIYQNFDPPFRTGINSYYSVLFQKMRENVQYNDPEVQTICNGLIDIVKFTRAMTMARCCWMPQMGKGSQCDETEIYKVISNSILSICKKRDIKNDQQRVIELQKQHNEQELKRIALKTGIEQ